MEFTTKETYLAAVKEWKVQYAALSNEIRNSRNAVKTLNREYSKFPLWSPKELKEERNLRRDAETALITEIYTRFKLKSTATAMLEERAAGKVEANRQYHLLHPAK